MSPVQFQPSPVKDGRRVLGEKPANACLSPAHNRTIDAATSPLKRPIFDQRHTSSSPKKLLPSPSFGPAGQKRTIDQVEENRPAPVNKGSLHVVREEEETTRYTGHDVARSNQKETELEPEPPHAMDTSRPQEQKQALPIESRQHNLSTDVLNNPTRTIPEDPETRKVFIQEKANLLRTRIQSAMRHVRDHQFDRRLSELEAHSRKYPRLTKKPQQTGTLQKTRSNVTTAAASLLSEPETEETTPRTLQPAPELKARAEEGPTSKNNKDDNNTSAGLSSPPLSTNNTTDPMKTPTQQTYQQSREGAPGSPMQLSSPPASISRDRSDQHEKNRCDHDTENVARTPSQQGDAVDGLLKLMNTAERREHSA
ncbi:uncharacterized protein ACHE_21064A [Aspergillus chevalieri]|uniref:Uncharacterized protein n=1 Tax=Aspergillus chevalieri TaxID=182096 RepID=A0A7R7VJ21_ASPCH|nr:uncharacterized protein ACHE_21064A [Aspergillus chevalieri]BCR85606.1 hypothetical protein ACHE_21064A [Aspergillus chevalieri]